MVPLIIEKCNMSFQKTWLKNRSKTKVDKVSSLKYLLNRVKDKEDREKLKQLIELYLDSHDFVTQVGYEIAKMSDKHLTEKK